jgi:hypothetical protein
VQKWLVVGRGGWWGWWLQHYESYLWRTQQSHQPADGQRPETVRLIHDDSSAALALAIHGNIPFDLVEGRNVQCVGAVVFVYARFAGCSVVLSIPPILPNVRKSDVYVVFGPVSKPLANHAQTGSKVVAGRRWDPLPGQTPVTPNGRRVAFILSSSCPSVPPGNFGHLLSSLHRDHESKAQSEYMDKSVWARTVILRAAEEKG